MEKFGDWLRETLREKRISQAELARRIGVTAAQISHLILGERGTTPETLRLIADALNMPYEEVLRIAGILPPIPKKDIMEEKADYLYQQLNQENKQKAIEYLEFLNQQENKAGRNARSKKTPSSNLA